jgi:hypothetical protein
MSLFRSLTLLALASALAAAIPAPAVHAGGDVIPPKTFGRKFPEGQYCPLPVSISFTPPTSAVVIYFDANNYVEDNGAPLWTNQSIDNVTVATTAQVSAHTFGPPEGNCESCYVDDDGEPIEPAVSYFYFNDPGLTLNLIELFDTHPGPRGWDLSNGGYYLDSSTPTPPFSAPRNPATCLDVNNGGSLGLGVESATPSLSEIATSSIEVSGLTPDTSYDLSAWWNSQRVGFPHDDIYLTIRIETPDGTPVARRSWGSLKAGYKR